MSVAAVVLAAGGSTRMGQPKQLLTFGGRTLLRRTAEVALGAGGDPVFVVLGAGAEQVASELDGLNVTAVVNGEWAAGPGTSVRAGIAALERLPGVEAAVFLLCDQPLVGAIGEIGNVGVSAAIANAVFHATGKRVRDFPITPEKLL